MASPPRSDVYALGAVGYELLAGRLPYDVSDRSVLEALQLIRHTEPLPLSNHGKAFRGDLDTIFAKALQKDREQRYQSASELANDLRRYLSGDVIMARAPSFFYGLRKAAARHRSIVFGEKLWRIVRKRGTPLKQGTFRAGHWSILESWI